MKMPAYQAAQSYNLAKTALKSEGSQPKPQEALGTGQSTEANSAFKAVHDLASTITKGEQASMAYMTGSADPHSVVEALAAAELAVETAVTVRDKVVEAYQELIRMPV
ncbi:flagellar hook-basal body complex protein FliE [Hyphococcus lacteus]|uniref:Flagellar hook-basal body complex protein FliE n=1 Tax=Hyphococcus lacteus TaxID=3143536 RepID=A0ABV3Z825_9PROT